jgi:hypothetical protein
LVRLHIFPHWLTGDHYRDFLLNYLPDLLEDVPVVVREHVYARWCFSRFQLWYAGCLQWYLS